MGSCKGEYIASISQTAVVVVVLLLTVAERPDMALAVYRAQLYVLT